MVFTTIFSITDFEGQHYRKVEKVSCRPAIKMKSKTLLEAKAECHQNPNCGMMYAYHGDSDIEWRIIDIMESKKKFFFCSTRNAVLKKSHGTIKFFNPPGYMSYSRVTYIKGRRFFVFNHTKKGLK